MKRKIPITALLFLPLMMAIVAAADKIDKVTVTGDFGVRQGKEGPYAILIENNHVGINAGNTPKNTLTVSDYNGDNAVFHSSGPYGASIVISTSEDYTDYFTRVGVAATPLDIGYITYNDAKELPALAISSMNFIGINEVAPKAHLHVTGKMRYVDGSQGSRKVLSSDADGTASWITHPGDELLSGNNTFSGQNTFNQPISGSVTGNAGTVTNGVYTTSQLAGDVTGTTGATVVGDDSHSHTSATIGSVNADVINSGTVADARLSSTVTKAGNSFNGISQLVQTDSTGKLPVIDGSALTGMTKAQVGLGNVQNVDQTDASNLASGTVANARLSANVTKAGNSFNGISQLVQTDSAGKLPVIDGSALTGITKAQIGLANVQNVDQTDASNLASGTVADARLSANVTKAGNSFNGISQLVQTDSTGKLPVIDGSALTGMTKAQVGLGNVQNVDQTDASNLASGTVADARLSATVTKAGNSFNGVSQLVQTDSAGKLPVLDGSALTGMTKAQVGLANVQNVDQTDASNLASGTIADARLSSTVTKAGNSFNGVSQLVQLDASGKLPAVDGSQLTGLPAGGDAFLAGAQTFTGQKTFSQPIIGDVTGNAGTVTNGVYTTSQLAGDVTGTIGATIVGDDSHSHTSATIGSVNADVINSGTVADARLSSTVTKAGNSFNGVSQLVQTDSTGKLPVVDGSALTGISKAQVGLGNVQNVDQTDASNLASGTVADARLSSTVTKAGNSFNGVSQLVQTDSAGKLPVLDGSELTGMTKAQVGLANVQNVDQTDASNLASGTVADARLSANVTKAGNSFNGVSQLVQTDSAGKLPVIDGSALTGITKAQVGLANVQNVDQTDASNLASGTVSDAKLSSTVTKAGNSFNGVSQLVQLDASGKLPAVDGSQLTGLPGGGDAFLAGTQTFTGQKTFSQPIIGDVTGNAGTVTNGVYTTSQLSGDVTGTTGATIVGDDSHSHTSATIGSVNAGVINSGTVADARLSSNITKAGNSFNGFGQLIMADPHGQIGINGEMDWNYDNFVIRRSTSNGWNPKMLSFLLGADATNGTRLADHWTFSILNSAPINASTTSDANTKLILSGPSSFGFDVDGNVGVGTVSPGYKMDVRGSSYPRMRIASTDGTAAGLYLGLNNELRSQIAVDNNDTYFDYSGAIGRLFFRSGVEGPAKITFEPNGSIVHIGNLVMLGTNGTNHIQFPDGSKMYSANSGNPAGTVITFAGSNCPAGYLAANGSAISRTGYASLFSALGTTYGTGDGSTTFNLPDMRGYFVRGYDSGAGVDSGRTFGSKQDDAFQGHNHPIVFDVGEILNGAAGSGTVSRLSMGNDIAYGTINRSQTYYSDNAHGTPRVASETRPKNIAMLYCVKS